MAAAAAIAGGVAAPVRLAGSIVLGAVVAVVLFGAMRYLILSEAPPVEDAGAPPQIDILADRAESNLILRDLRPDAPEEVKAPPPPPRIQAAASEQPEEGLASILGALPEIQPDAVASDDISFVVADRDVQPLVRIPPNYPIRAQEQGLEGSCDMTFDVLPDGSIDEATIAATCTSSVFAREASRAIARYKYAPKIVNGEAVVQRGLRQTIEFSFAE